MAIVRQERGASAEARAAAITRAMEDGNSVHTILHVTIVGAKGLRKVAGRVLKPYVKCQLLGKPDSQINSPESDSKDGRNPAWNFEGMVAGCCLGDALEFFVFSDTAGECVGRGELSSALFRERGFAGSVQLEDRMSTKCTLEVKVEANPVPVNIPDAEEDDEEKGRCFISFISAEGLRPPAGVVKANPFVICAVPDREETAQTALPLQSGFLINTLRPEWNELHELDDYALGDNLVFTVYHWDPNTKKKTEMGSAMVTTGDFHELGFHGDLQLSGENDQGEAHTGVLRVRIDVNGVAEQPNTTIDIFAQIGGSRNLNLDDFDQDKVRMFDEGEIEGIKDLDHDLPTLKEAMAAARAARANMRRRERTEDGVQAQEEEKHPSQLINKEDRQPVPFQLRSLDTGNVHRLSAYTTVGRSRTLLDERFDLILDNPGSIDVSRAHAAIKVWQETDLITWGAAVYEYEKDRGSYYDEEGERRRIGGGTTVDGEPVDFYVGTLIQPGSVLRFGVNEVWVMEAAKLHQRSRAAEAASRKARLAANEDPSNIRELVVPNFTCDSALHRCQDWISIVRVVLEARHEPDEAPCADVIEVKDEIGRPVSRHEAFTLEQQEAYDVRSILRDVRLGTTLSLRLSDDPLLLAPVLGKVDKAAAATAEIYMSRSHVLT